MLSVISRLTSCAALLCRACGNLTACVAERYLTLRTGYEKHGRKNPLPYPISERSHVGNLRQIRKQGKGRSSKRKGNRRCPFLFALRRGYGAVPALRRAQLPAEVQRKTPRPSGANPPAAVRVPRSADAEKEPPVRGEPACGSSCAPVSRCRKGAARQRRTRLRQFVCPGQPAQKRSRPSGANPPAAVRVPRSAGAGKGAARQGRTRLRQFVCPGHLVPRKEKHRRIASTVLKVCTFTQIAAAYRHPYAPEPAGPVPDDRAR